MPTSPKNNPGRDCWLSKLMTEVGDQKVQELKGEFNYLEGVHELVRTGIFKIVEELLSPESFREKIATALKTKYPDKLSDEIAEKISVRLAEAITDATTIRRILHASDLQMGKATLERMLAERQGNISSLSKTLGINRVTAYAWLNKNGIDYKKMRNKKGR